MKRVLAGGLPVAVAVALASAALAASASASVSIPLQSGSGGPAGSPDPGNTVLFDTFYDPGSNPQPALNVTPHPAYAAPLAPSNFIAPAVDSNGLGLAGTTTVYQASFLLPVNSTSPQASLSVLTDNQTTAMQINNNPSFGSQPYDCTVGTNFKSPSGPFTTSSGFLPGQTNTLTITTFNCENPGFGALDYQGQVTYTPVTPTEDQCEMSFGSVVDPNTGQPYSSTTACDLAATGTTIGSLPKGGNCNNLAIVGPVKGDIVVPPGATCLLSSNSSVSHDVKVGKGATLYSAASIGHDLSADHPNQIDVDAGSTVGHDISIDGLMGGTDNEICGTSVGHDLVVKNGAAGAGAMQVGCPDEGGGNTVGHDLVVQDNHNTVTVNGNSAGHEAKCNDGAGGTGNTPASSTCNTV